METGRFVKKSFLYKSFRYELKQWNDTKISFTFVNKKNILGEYNSFDFFKPSTWKYLNLDWIIYRNLSKWPVNDLISERRSAERQVVGSKPARTNTKPKVFKKLSKIISAGWDLRTGVITVYMGKPVIPVGEWNGWTQSVAKIKIKLAAKKNWGDAIFSTLFSLFR